MGFRELDAWNVAMDLAVKIHETTKSFPRDERYGMTAQMRRASVSIAANIAEGYGRRSPADYVRFLRIAKGSTNELETLVLLARRLDYLVPDDALLELTARVGSMLSGLIKSLEGNVVREIATLYSEDDTFFDD
jgi:four helix bundle protein